MKFRSEASKTFFFEKKKQKLLLNAGICQGCAPAPGQSKFCCCFLFTKGSFFFACLLLLPWPALAYDNSACWHYAEQQGPRPDITCTAITLALLDSLQNAALPQVIAVMNEPGEPYPDGTLHYTGNDLNNDGGFQGVIALTITGGAVAGIDAKLDDPTQGGAYFTYRWVAGGTACSDLPGSQKPC